MTYQMIDGVKVYIVAAKWFRLPKNPTPEMVNLRKNQILHYSGGNIAMHEPLLQLANGETVKSPNKLAMETLEEILERMKANGVTAFKDRN